MRFGPMSAVGPDANDHIRPNADLYPAQPDPVALPTNSQAAEERMIFAATMFAVALAATPGAAVPSAQPLGAMTVEQADAAVMDYYPAAARAAGVEGWARVNCPSNLSDCVVVSEHPVGSGFGQAAVMLMSRWRSMQRARPEMPPQMPPQPSTVTIHRFTFSLKPPVILPNPLRPVMVITNPDWAKRPDFWAMVWPAAAYHQHVNGEVVLECFVTEEGRANPCTVTEESPQGWGFGPAALSFASTFRLRPMLIDGQPEGGGRMRIPLKFNAPK